MERIETLNLKTETDALEAGHGITLYTFDEYGRLMHYAHIVASTPKEREDGYADYFLTIFKGGDDMRRFDTDDGNDYPNFESIIGSIKTIWSNTPIWWERDGSVPGVDAGITLDEDDQHEVDEQFSYIELSAKQYKYSSVSKYLQAVYGNGVTKKVARHMLELSQLASKYSQQQYDSYTYTDEQIAENYAENKNSYDVFNYQYYLVQAATEETTGADGNTSTATTDATMAAAKATADKIAAATHDADSFAAAVTANVPATTSDDGTAKAPSVTSNTNAKGSSVSSAPYAEWLYSAERTANNVTVVEQENTGYYVVLFQSRDDNSYNTVSARHILIKAADSDNDGTYSDDDKQKAKASIDDVYERWMQSDQTEDDFAQLANSFSQDSGSNTKGGLYEHIYKGQMVQEFNDFCFDPARKPGDVGMVFNESDSYCGYHLVYFVGQGERYCDYLADQALRSADFEKWESAFFNDWSATELNGMKYVG